jgi:hypothetical protein
VRGNPADAKRRRRGGMGMARPQRAAEMRNIAPCSSPRAVRIGRERAARRQSLPAQDAPARRGAACRLSSPVQPDRCRQVAERPAKRRPRTDSLTPVPRRPAQAARVERESVSHGPMTDDAAHFVPTTGEVRPAEPWNPAR